MPSQIEQAILRAAVAYLNENAGKHRRARWHLDVKRAPGEMEASSYAGRFDSEDEEAIEQDLDFVGHHMLDDKVLPIIEASTKSDPVATIDFIFERDGKGWKHAGFVHTVSQREALESQRAELDARLRDALGGLASEGWTSISLSYAWDEPMRLVRMVENEPEPLSSPAVDEVMAGYGQFFAERELELRFMDAAIGPEPTPTGNFNIRLSYGTPRKGTTQ